MSNDLQHLKNLIERAESNISIDVLRKIIKAGIDEAPPGDVIKMAKTMLQCGIDIERAERN